MKLRAKTVYIALIASAGAGILLALIADAFGWGLSHW